MWKNLVQEVHQLELPHVHPHATEHERVRAYPMPKLFLMQFHSFLAKFLKWLALICPTVAII